MLGGGYRSRYWRSWERGSSILIRTDDPRVKEQQMSIKIDVSHLRQYTDDQQTVEINGSTVGQCLDHLIKQYPSIEQQLFDEDGKLHNEIDIFINREFLHSEDLDKLVKDGDELHIAFLIGGG